MIVPSKLVSERQRLDLVAKDLDELTAQVASEVGLVAAEIFLAPAVEDGEEPQPFANMAALGARAKVQIWPAKKSDAADEDDEDGEVGRARAGDDLDDL